MGSIEICEFSEVEYLSDIAAGDDTTPADYMAPKPRTKDTWFHIPDKACGCLWFPGNRSNTMRFSHCYVKPDARGDGKGKALAVFRYQYAKKHPKCERMDVLAAHSPGLFADFGFDVVDRRGEDDHIFYMEKELDEE